MPKLSDKSQMLWALPRNKPAKGMAARTRLRAGLQEKRLPPPPSGVTWEEEAPVGARWVGGGGQPRSPCGDSSAVCAKPRSLRCRVGAGSLNSTGVSVWSIDHSIPMGMIHPRPHRKPEAGRRGLGGGREWMLCELELVVVARGQRNLVPAWAVVQPLVWATEGGSNSFEARYPMTAPVETLFSPLTSE